MRIYSLTLLLLCFASQISHSELSGLHKAGDPILNMSNDERITGFDETATSISRTVTENSCIADINRRYSEGDIIKVFDDEYICTHIGTSSQNNKAFYWERVSNREVFYDEFELYDMGVTN